MGMSVQERQEVNTNNDMIKRIFMLYSSFKSDQNNCEINSQVPGVQVEMQKMQKMSTTGWWGLFS